MGNPFVHVDLAADDVPAAKKFYKAVFDWQFQDFPEMQWTGVMVGDGVGGGMGGKNMPGQPTAWTPYVGVADVKKTIAKAQKAGAHILVPYMDIGTTGALGLFRDPQGGVIGVWQQKAQPAAKKAAKKAAPKKKAAKKAAPKRKAAAPKKKAAKKK